MHEQNKNISNVPYSSPVINLLFSFSGTLLDSQTCLLFLILRTSLQSVKWDALRCIHLAFLKSTLIFNDIFNGYFIFYYGKLSISEDYNMFNFTSYAGCEILLANVTLWLCSFRSLFFLYQVHVYEEKIVSSGPLS